MVERVFDRAVLVDVGLIAGQADVHDPGAVVDSPPDPGGDVAADGALVAHGRADGHDRTGPAVPGDPHAVVPLGADNGRNPGAVPEAVPCVAVASDDVPARHDVSHVRLGRGREPGVDDRDHDARISRRVLPEIGRAGQARPPLEGPKRIVRLRAGPTGSSGSQQEKDEQNQAEAPHEGEL